MSSYDDDEALFEDIYGDDDTPVRDDAGKEPAKEKTPEPPKDANVSSVLSATDAATATTATSNPAANPAATTAAAPDAGAPPVDISSMVPAHLQEQFQQFQQFQKQLQLQQQQQQQQQPPPAPVAAPEPPKINPPSDMGRGSGKMFIGGLNWDTDEDKLLAYFSKFGNVIEHSIMRDSATGRSRGFGFLTFEDASSVDAVIKSDHVLDGKLIDPKRAIAREEQDKVGKIFVGGIDPMVTEKDFDEFFSQFGRIIDCQLMIDKDTGRSRGYGFITYDSPDAVDKVTVNKYLTLKGKAMEVKRAEPRGQHQQNQLQAQRQQTMQYNPYGQYGQQQYGQTQTANAYAPSMNGMAPEMMQEYWQRMQQWYMLQGQQQTAAGSTEAPEQQPLNPQQQESAEPPIPEPPAPERKDARNDNNGGYNQNHNQYQNQKHGNGYSNREPRKFNSIPRGPRRSLPSGPSGGRGGGYRGRGRGGGGGGGYHPYSRGGGRR